MRLLVLAALTWAFLMPAAQATHVELAQAQATITVDGAASRGERVTLPYHWDRQNPGLQGWAEFELTFPLTAGPDAPLALYVTRLGNAYEVWLNGTLLQKNGDLDEYNGADYAKVPRYLLVPAALLQDNNVLRVRVRADIGRRGGLSPLVIGPEDHVYPLYLRDYRWRSTGTLVVVVLSFLVGLMAMALWATQTDDLLPSGGVRRDPLYFYAGVAELCWALSACNAIIEQPPLAWPLWGVVTVVSSAIWVLSMTMFCVEVAQWRSSALAAWLRPWLALELVGVFAAAVAALRLGYPAALTASYAVSGATSLLFSAVFIAGAVRRASLPHKIVAVALVLNTLVGLRDLYAFRLSAAYEGNTFLRYSSVLFALVLGYIVLARFRSVAAQARDLRATLAGRVAQKEAELAVSFQKVEQLARQQERTSERARILRDMHDGVGSHISSAIRQLESGRASNAQVLQTLRDSLDQLKLSIDAMNLPPGDITALLANLRYRLEPRFAASDIELQWDVDLIEPLRRLDVQGMRQLQFMLFEALSNVLQHAQASVLRIEATAWGPGVHLRIIDNGRGFDVDAPLRKGLLSLRERAAAIGAEVILTSEPGHTVVEIQID